MSFGLKAEATDDDLRRRSAFGYAAREARLVSARSVAVNEPFRGHLVDERDGLTKSIANRLRIVAVDGGADVPQGAAKPGAKLSVVLAAFEVLSVRFERGVVTGHSWIDP
jgi:hypothetical protein